MRERKEYSNNKVLLYSELEKELSNLVEKNIIPSKIAEKLGFRWIMVDGSAFDESPKFLNFVYKRKGGKLIIMPRNNDISMRIAFGAVRSLLGLIRAVGASEWQKWQYMILVLDGETFGHYRPNLIRFLHTLFRAGKEDKRLKLTTVSEIIRTFPKRRSVEVSASTWG